MRQRHVIRDHTTAVSTSKSAILGLSCAEPSCCASKKDTERNEVSRLGSCQHSRDIIESGITRSGEYRALQAANADYLLSCVTECALKRQMIYQISRSTQRMGRFILCSGKVGAWLHSDTNHGRGQGD